MKKTKNGHNLLFKFLSLILSAYVMLSLLFLIFTKDLLIFWPLILYTIIISFAAYVTFKAYKNEASRRLFIGILVEAFLITMMWSSNILGSLAEEMGLKCEGILGQTTRCTESITYTPEYIGVLLLFPMLVVAAIFTFYRVK